MEAVQNRPPGYAAADEELIDTLIAVSIVAKRLAERLRKQNGKENAPGAVGETAWEAERTGGK